MQVAAWSKKKALDVDMELEDALFSWILEMRSRHLRVSRKMIRQQARSLSSAKDFHASTGLRTRSKRHHATSDFIWITTLGIRQNSSNLIEAGLK